MPTGSPEDPRAVRNRLIWEDAFGWIGRIFATMVFMVGPALAGLWLDRQFGTKFIAAIGIMVGMALGITALLILVNVKRPSLDEGADELLKADRDQSHDRRPGSSQEARDSRSPERMDDDQASP